ncbi:methylmalonyl-CoA mutase family protein [Actinophytocola sp.]|uniref:methylmalonyl-CoA mutase family protein n=1 Tax=Actinophytocola sp. TaxID=1872138 RepID=UPI003D6C02BF
MTSREDARAAGAEISERLAHWRDHTLRKSQERLGGEANRAVAEPATPLRVNGHDYLRDVGLPGEYPFTSWLYPTPTPFHGGGGATATRAGRYSGYGTSEDCRDYYLEAARSGMRVGGPNVASDLPTQLGWDSDSDEAAGEVGQVGVAIDSLRDFENIYAAFGDPPELATISSNWTINAPAAVYVAFYCALARKHDVPLAALRCTPQNDILKEFVARGLYIFPVRESLRLTRDVIDFTARHMPRSNSISICAEHMRYAGASTPDSFAFAFANAKEYVRQGIAVGLDPDDFVRRFTFRGFGDSTLDFLRGIAAPRAARRMWARIMREEFGAKSDRACLLRGGEHAWGNAYLRMTTTRPINNIVRETVEAIIQATASGQLSGSFPFDEPLGLGHSREAQQVRRDLERILFHEAKLGATLDPFAGSYVIEALTDEIEADTLDALERVEQRGGAIAAVESGYYRDRIASNAWDQQRAMEVGDDVWVGVNAFTGEDELDVEVKLTPEYPGEKLASAEERQCAALRELRAERDDAAVAATLRALEKAARDERHNVMPELIDCALAYATVGEICDVLRDCFGLADSAVPTGTGAR